MSGTREPEARKEDWTVWSCRHLPVEVEVKGGGISGLVVDIEG